MNQHMTTERKTATHNMRRYRAGQFDPLPYHALLTNVGWHSAAPRQRRLLSFTSSNRHEGVSTIVCQLAISTAFDSKNVLLVDLNEDHPNLGFVFNLSKNQGFIEYVRDGSLESIQASRIPNLSVMPFGVPPFEAPLAMPFESLMEPLLDQFELVILDLPAVSSGPSMLRWAPYLDSLILVVSSQTSTEIASKAIEVVRGAGGTLCGVVQNEI